MDKETLAQYVSRILEENGIGPLDVEERSERQITDSYVANIASGKQKNPTISKLQALAKGLDVDEDELFLVARGYAAHRQGELWSVEAMLNSMRKVASSRDLTRAVKELIKLKPGQLKAVIAFIESKTKP
jgi:transcriptional regulator with XRE-family HTH domain